MSPCKECAKLIHQSGIRRLVYLKNYKDSTGLDFLKKAGVIIDQIKEEEFEKNNRNLVLSLLLFTGFFCCHLFDWHSA